MRQIATTGTLHGGKVRLDDKTGFAADLAGLKDGSIVVTVALASPDVIRSTRANRYYYGCVLARIAAAAEGNTVDDIHDAMCERFLSRHVFLVNKQTGEVEEHTVAERSSKLPPDRFQHFVDEVREFGQTFFGIDIPDPDPAWRLNRSEAA